MAEIKEYLDLQGFTHAVEKIKGYADGLATNYDPAGTATTKVKELEDGQVKTNKEAIAKLNGDETVVGSVAKSIKDAKTELEGKIKSSVYNDTELKGRVTATETDITTLKGTGEGSIKKQIDDAFNDFSTKVSDDDVVNTYKELIDYAAAHKGEAATMAGDISKNAEAIKTLETYVGKLPEGTDAKTVIDYINKKIDGSQVLLNRQNRLQLILLPQMQQQKLLQQRKMQRLMLMDLQKTMQHLTREQRRILHYRNRILFLEQQTEQSL